MANGAIDWQGLWNYVFGTSEPPPDAVEHGQTEHLHLDRGSGRWVAPEEAREKTAA